MKVATFKDPFASLDVQPVIPVTPEIVQVPTPLGVIAPSGPVTVAVKMMVEPRAAVLKALVTLMVGLAALTFVT